jgi:hypothetical protein
MYSGRDVNDGKRVARRSVKRRDGEEEKKGRRSSPYPYSHPAIIPSLPFHLPIDS